MSEVGFEFHTVSHTAWKTMLEDVKQAKISIDMEQYIFALDKLGQEFLDVFIERAQQGVKVRLLLDTAGSYGFYRTGIADKLAQKGIEVRFYNPLSAWRLANFTSNFFRNHRKSLVIDGKIGHIGGVNIGLYMKDWRDTHVRLTGQIVNDITETFNSLWNNLTKRIVLKVRQPHHYIKNFSIQTNAPGFRQRYIYQSIIASIRRSQKYVYLTSPYFVPDRRLFRVIRLAAKRGVDVRLLVPSIADHFFVDYARESYYTLLLQSGVKIYRYSHIMMHAKSAIVDDEWSTTGSYNLDNLSALFNHELNVTSTDHVFIERLKGHFLDDLKNSVQIYYDQWIHRSIFRKMLELFTWPFHSIL